MPYLIDGYNLLYAYLGAPPKRSLAHGWERARKRLLELLRTGHAQKQAEVTVVFDAANAPRNAPAEFDYDGIHVVFAVHEAHADDEIEDRIRHASAPRQLAVVSDDRRIQQAARRRHCQVLGCADYLDWLEKHENRVEPASKPQDQATLPPEDAEHWLREFADLVDDPALKELEPHGLTGDEELPEE